MKKNNQLIALLVFVPMLIFTLLVTLNTPKDISYYDEAEDVLYKYFDYKNSKDLASLSTLLLNKETLQSIESEINLIEKISIINIDEEKSKSIIDAYLRNDNQSSSDNVRVFKVSYEVQYNSKELSHKDGLYESWCFLTRESDNSKWLIDIFDV